MSNYLGNISVFDHNSQEWEIYYGRFQQFLKINGALIEDGNRSALLLTHLSEDTYLLARNLIHPEKIDGIDYDELVKVLSDHFKPKRSTFVSKAKFYKAVRAPGESVEVWAVRIRGLAVHCDFGSALDMILRDKFVLGMGAGPERDRLFEQDASELTFARALELAHQAESSPQAMRAAERKDSMNRAGPSGRRSVQGPRNQLNAKNVRCKACGEKGCNCKEKECTQKGSASVHKMDVDGPTWSKEDDQHEDCEEPELINLRLSDEAATPATSSAAHGADAVPFKGMLGSHSPWKAPEFPLVHPARDHTVLYKIPTKGFGAQLSAVAGPDMWDNHHVKMPTSKRSVYDVNQRTITEQRWMIVQKTLQQKPIRNSQNLADAILKYNTKFKNTWSFASMHRFFNQYWSPGESQEFFKTTIPCIVRLVLDLPRLVQAPIQLLRKEDNRSISMTQLQIASLLANAFFCTFPRRNIIGPGTEYSEYPRINFASLYESNADGVMEKLKCICHYFRRVCNMVPIGVVTFSRRHVPTRSCPNFELSQVKIDSVPLHVDKQMAIEDADGLIQVDFANKYLGGGVLSNGLEQEEIRFVICPELMVAMLFTEKLGPNDALMIIGCERYSRYTGYDKVNFKWAGDFQDTTPRDSSGRRRRALLAIDAHNYQQDERKQYHRDMIFRELNKAWIGFSFYIDPSSQGVQYPGVATGNWGCGAFGGSPQLKSLIQIMACAQARRPIAYFTSTDTLLKEDLINVHNMLKQHNVTVGELFNLFSKYYGTNSQVELHAFLKNELKHKDKLPQYLPSAPPHPWDSSAHGAPMYPSTRGNLHSDMHYIFPSLRRLHNP